MKIHNKWAEKARILKESSKEAFKTVHPSFKGNVERIKVNMLVSQSSKKLRG
jgi:hypothetical protein